MSEKHNAPLFEQRGEARNTWVRRLIRCARWNFTSVATSIAIASVRFPGGGFFMGELTFLLWLTSLASVIYLTAKE